MADQLKRLLLENSRVRGAIISLDSSWQQIIARHTAPASVLNCLGELSAASLLLASSIKFDGFLVLQIQGDGPVSLMVAEADAVGVLRSTFRLREGQQAANDADLRSLVNASGLGRFAVTLAPRSKHQQPYQGIVSFEAEDVAGLLERYMQTSEQIQTRLWLAADEQRAVGLILQQLPAEGGTNAEVPKSEQEIQLDHENWQRLVHFASTLSREEMLKEDSDEILKRLFWEEPIRLTETRPCQFRCQCSRAKVASMLQMLGKPEIDSIVAEQNQVAVNCEFCNAPYVFDAVDAAALFNADGSAAQTIETVIVPTSQLQ
jgi:molecular chaperone Hsp33